VGRRPWGGMAAHVAVGLVAGIFFGGALVALKAIGAAEPLPTVDIVSQAINELLFPVGCSLVIFCAEALGERVVRRPDHCQSPSKSAALPAGRAGSIGIAFALVLGIAIVVVECYLLYRLYTAPALSSPAPDNVSASSRAAPEGGVGVEVVARRTKPRIRHATEKRPEEPGVAVRELNLAGHGGESWRPPQSAAISKGAPWAGLLIAEHIPLGQRWMRPQGEWIDNAEDVFLRGSGSRHTLR